MSSSRAALDLVESPGPALGGVPPLTEGVLPVSERSGAADGPPERVHFFDGQLLGRDDFRAEQDYHRRMRYLHNRLLHGWGVVEGFAVDADDGGVPVGPGVAIDSLGRELVLPAPAHL